MILICEHRITTVTCLTLATVIFSTDSLLYDLIYNIALGIYPTLNMLYLTRDIWHRHLTCYTWYMIYDTALGIYTGTWYVILDFWCTVLDIRHQNLICHTWHLILTPGIWHAFMWYKYIDLTSWPLTGHYRPWYLYYMAYSWLSLLRGLDMIIILLPDIWYLWTPVLLYTCEIGRLLTLLLILYSCWPL